MKLTALFLAAFIFITADSKAQDLCPLNIDFELGSFTNWQCDTGSTYASGNQNVITLAQSGPLANRHEIMSLANGIQIDPYGNFPMVCPAGGGYSVKLGNTVGGKQAESISYTFQVPPGQDTFSLTYYYAVVFQNPGHSSWEQPRFEVKAIDVNTGLPVNCASYQFVAVGALPGFDTSLIDQNVLYKRWTPVSLSLSGLAGRTVQLRFTTADCTRGGHFGYAYVDVQAGCSPIIANAAHCLGTNTAVLNAPFGYKNYTWFNNNYTQVMGSGQSISITPSPPVGTLFHVDLEPYPGYGCRDTADAVVTELPIPDTPVAQSYIVYCKNNPSSELTATPSSGANILYWYNSSFGGIPNVNAPTPSTAVPGIYHYYVSQKEPFGCESFRKEITVEVKANPLAGFSVNQVSQCLDGNNYLFTNTSQTLDPNSTYEWSFGDGAVSTQASPAHAYTTGGYFDVGLKVTNPPSCTGQFSLQMRVIPRPVASFNSPVSICDNQTQVLLTDNSTVPTGITFLNYWYWNINGVTSTLQNPLPFTSPAGNIVIKQVATTIEGCYSDTNTVILPVHYLPTAKFSYSTPLCDNETIRFFDQSYMPAAAPAQEQVSKWTWTASNGSSSSVQNPSFHFSTGLFDTKLVAETNFGCTSVVADSFFLIHEKPSVQVTMSDSCINRTISIQAKDQLGNVSEWWWNFGPGLYQSQQTMTRSFPSPGQHSFTLIGKTIYGCKDTLVHPFKMYKLNIFAGNDTVTAMNEPVQLHSIASDVVAQYVWSPPTGLNDPTKADPVAILDRDQQYFLSAISDKGCEAYSKVLVRRYKGPNLYIPTGFTPNGDGLNDVLKVFPVGIKSFTKFSVFNRGGELVFTTDDASRGWDGTFKGGLAATGSYVVTAKAIDYKGNVMEVKQNVILIR